MKIRHQVSKSKRRYIDPENNIDLDLSYINSKIVAMGFPSEGSESVYRNPMPEVQRMLEMYHKNHYKVYNLCSERSYDHKKFHHRVVRSPFDDHNCPMFRDIWKFCEDVKDWLNEHNENIAVIHCKAGKGRTGLMICCWLLYIKDWERADDAMKFYAAARTFNQKGVTIPSQIRYIRYFEQCMRIGALPNAENVTLSHIILHGIPKNVPEIKLTINVVRENVLTPVFHLKRKVKDLLKEQSKQGDKYSTPDSLSKLVIPCDVVLSGDVKLEFEKLLHFWIHTAYVQKNTILRKEEIDKAHKDKKCKTFVSDFRVELCFEGPDELFLQSSSALVGRSPAGSAAGSAGGTSSDFGLHKRQETNYSSQLAYKWAVNNYRSLLNV
eukprot:TRINITY_DN5217_c0_g1_i2.p1 TRINITY_DN5217_c0_g1~~TRINITY_DN5217_c0_g1_i2.p1  ORF type:complete len:381 (-),score=66.21 TRINITY_DN5217_c0_g1_i2:104-1246(-)